MIIFVSTFSHAYTHRYVAQAIPEFKRTSYQSILRQKHLPAATYIFSDFDRLGVWELELAAHIYRVLDKAGCRVYNDPARVLQRLPLLNALYQRRVNSFRVWPAFDAASVDRFPVFLRTSSAHRGVLTGLIANRATLATSLEAVLAEGYPIGNLLVVEHRAEPVHDNVYRKLAMYRVGDQMIPALSVHEQNWAAKYGENGVAGETAYLEELDRVKTNPYAKAVRDAFDIGKIQYGRADFGIVAGRLEIYEINTNPMVFGAISQHPFASRIEASRIIYGRYRAAMSALDHADPTVSGNIDITNLETIRFKRKNEVPDLIWTP